MEYNKPCEIELPQHPFSKKTLTSISFRNHMFGNSHQRNENQLLNESSTQTKIFDSIDSLTQKQIIYDKNMEILSKKEILPKDPKEEVNIQKIYSRKSHENRINLIEYLIYTLIYLNTDITILISKTKKQSTVTRNKFRIEFISLFDKVIYDYTKTCATQLDTDGRFIVKFENMIFPVLVDEIPSKEMSSEDRKNKTSRKEIEVLHVLYELVCISMSCEKEEDKNSPENEQEQEKMMVSEMKRLYQTKSNSTETKQRNYPAAFHLQYLPIFRDGKFIGKKKADECFQQEGYIIYQWLNTVFNEYKNDYLILGTKNETILKTIETREQKKTRKVYKVIDYSSNQFLNEINEKMKQTITLIPSDEKFTKRLAKEMKKNPEIKRVPFFTGKLN